MPAPSCHIVSTSNHLVVQPSSSLSAAAWDVPDGECVSCAHGPARGVRSLSGLSTSASEASTACPSSSSAGFSDVSADDAMRAWNEHVRTQLELLDRLARLEAFAKHLQTMEPLRQEQELCQEERLRNQMQERLEQGSSQNVSSLPAFGDYAACKRSYETLAPAGTTKGLEREGTLNEADDTRRHCQSLFPRN